MEESRPLNLSRLLSRTLSFTCYENKKQFKFINYFKYLFYHFCKCSFFSCYVPYLALYLKISHPYALMFLILIVSNRNMCRNELLFFGRKNISSGDFNFRLYNNHFLRGCVAAVFGASKDVDA